MADNIIGRVTPIWRGIYSASAAYDLNDIVIDADGSVWWHQGRQKTTGTAPRTDGTWAAVIDMSVFSAAIQNAIATAQKAVTDAEAAESGIEESVDRASAAADRAEIEARAAAVSSTAAGTSAEYAASSADAADASATAASGSATEASGFADAASGSATDASGYAQAASGSAAAAAGSATAADNSASAAAASAESVSASAAQIETNANDIADLKGQVSDLESAMDILYGETELPWSAIQEMENKGIAAKYLPVGTQLTEPWKLSASSEALTSVWDVVHHTADEMTLNWHYALPDGVQFDAPEAVYYVGSGGLAAGTYHIDIGASYGTGWVAGQSIQFTLASACDEDDQIVISLGSYNETNPTNSRTVSVYAKGSATAKQTATTSNGTGGTSLGTIGAESAQKINGQLNAISRAVYGSGRWSESAIRQYLNSAADAGAWWEPKNPWDRPPTQHTTLRGFLAGYSEEFLATIATTDVVTALNTVEGFDTTTEVTQDKIFLPCLNNWYIAPQLAGEGDAWGYYEALAQEAGISGKFKTGSKYPILIKYRLDTPSSPVSVWLRSCYRSLVGSAWLVNSAGGGSGSYYGTACNAYRGCPACKIVKSV